MKRLQNSDTVSIKPYLSRMSSMVGFQLVFDLILAAFLIGIKFLAGLLMRSASRPAVTSGDLPYFLRSWQGILLLLIGIVILFIYVAFDISATIIFSRKIVKSEKISIKEVLIKALSSIKKLLSPIGFLFVLFVTFIAPLISFGFGISLTSTFVIPDFILSVILKQPFLKILYYLFLLSMIVISFIYVYTYHYLNFKNMKVREAAKASRLLMKKHWLNFFKQMILLAIPVLLIFALVIAVFDVLPFWLITKVFSSSIPLFLYRFLLIFFSLTAVLVSVVGFVILINAFVIKVTLLFEAYNDGKLVAPKPKKKKAPRIVGVVLVIVVFSAASFFLTKQFDQIFPPISEKQIIAHRGAGYYGEENTVEAINTAIKFGAYASEIDIHRTKDGEFILNHDANFSRAAGDPRTPQEMTLAEIKQLRLHDGSQVPTLREVLETAKGKIYLYIELKGASADRQMVDDVYRMLKEYDMLKECSLISLKYDVIEYAEETYPEANTVYLVFFSFGDISDMKCDGIAFESESATEDNIYYVKQAGKRVDIWTCNTTTDIVNAVFSQADGLITDAIYDARKIGSIASVDDDLTRILSVFIPEI